MPVQLCNFLLGFYEVIPLPLISHLNVKELETLMCGISVIDVKVSPSMLYLMGTFDYIIERLTKLLPHAGVAEAHNL